MNDAERVFHSRYSCGCFEGSKMFKALDKVHYDSLQLNKPRIQEKSETPRIQPLLDLSCEAVNWHEDVDCLVQSLPIHLMPKLLQVAIEKQQGLAIAAIVANWPLQVLRFKDIIHDGMQHTFKEGMAMICRNVNKGLKLRSKKCKLRCLDFRDIGLHQSYCQYIIQTWPFQSLRKSQMKVKHLSSIISKVAGVQTRKLQEVIPKLVEQRLNDDAMKFDRKIVMPRGQRLEVKLDCLTFSAFDDTFTINYMITNCLRSVTPLFVTVKNIYIKTDLVEGDVVMDSLLPFVVLNSHDPEMLDGLSLRQLEDCIFNIMAKDVQKFKKLSNLDLQDCNIYLQEGITRSRTLSRSHLLKTLSSFENLQRLDLGFNYLLGCLEEVLDALVHPLEFLGLRGCDLNEKDLMSLAHSKHSTHLRELNLSKLCQLSIYESERISPVFLMNIVKHFPKLTLLNLSQNHLPNSGIAQFCDLLAQDMHELKGLDVAGNYLLFENQLELIKACAKILKMQWIRLTCTSNLFHNEANLNNHDMEEMISRLHNQFASLGREDIHVEVVRLSFAILVDVIDVFD